MNDADPMIGAAGRLAASTAISGTLTDPSGPTSTDDGLHTACPSTRQTSAITSVHVAAVRVRTASAL